MHRHSTSPGLLRALDRRLRPPLPATRLALLRLLVGGYALIYLAIRLPHLAAVGELGAASFRPVGVVSLLLEQPLSAGLPGLLAAIALALGAAFVAGWRFAITGPLFAAALLWVTSYRNSWGMIFHTENLMVLHVIAVGLGASADAWSLDARRRRRAATAATAEPAADPRYGWPIALAAALTVITYALAGIAKLRISGLEWMTSDILRNTVAFDNLRKIELGDSFSRLGVALAEHPAIFPWLAALSLGLELLAPLALLGRRLALLWSVGAWSFHLGVLALMWIFFPYPLLGVAYAPILLLVHPLATHKARPGLHIS